MVLILICIDCAFALRGDQWLRLLRDSRKSYGDFTRIADRILVNCRRTWQGSQTAKIMDTRPYSASCGDGKDPPVEHLGMCLDQVRFSLHYSNLNI